MGLMLEWIDRDEMVEFPLHMRYILTHKKCIKLVLSEVDDELIISVSA